MTKDRLTTEISTNHSKLFGLIRKAVNEVATDADTTTTRYKEAQLREIARTIERLEKLQVGVPDSLREEKTRLVATLGVREDIVNSLMQLASGLETILTEVSDRLYELGRETPRHGRPKQNGNRTQRRSKLPKTDNTTLRKYILAALKNLGGSAKANAVVDEMAKLLAGILLDGDTEPLGSRGVQTWRYNAGLERRQMILDGCLKNDSPHGMWELSDYTK